MMRNLPSQNREFVNLVEVYNQKRKPIRQDDISMFMHNPGSSTVSREGSPHATAIRTAGSEPIPDRRPSIWLGQNDAVTQLMQEVQRSPTSPVTIARQASSPVIMSRGDKEGTMYNAAQSMLDVVKGQDSRMEVKRERVKLLKENMRHNSTLMARCVLLLPAAVGGVVGLGLGTVLWVGVGLCVGVCGVKFHPLGGRGRWYFFGAQCHRALYTPCERCMFTVPTAALPWVLFYLWGRRGLATESAGGGSG